MALEAPAIYFMCHHAFHAHCLHDVHECNLCGPIHRQQLQSLLSHNAIANSSVANTHVNAQNHSVSNSGEVDINTVSNSYNFFQNIIVGVCSVDRLYHHNIKNNSNNKKNSIA